MTEGVGKYNIPEIKPISSFSSPDHWIAFDKAGKEKKKEDTGIHFYLDDYQFLRTWNNPDMQIDVLRKFKYVCSPNFSLYIDYPKAIQIYNHYRNQWLGAYWQLHGINVIPTVCWGDYSSYEFCFDGHPKNNPVMISTVGMTHSKELRELFIDGYFEMKQRLNPSLILCYGKLREELEDDGVINIGSPDDRFKPLHNFSEE